jgi:hypothetical protein
VLHIESACFSIPTVGRILMVRRNTMLKFAQGLELVEIWPDHLDDGLRDLARRLDRPDLTQ